MRNALMGILVVGCLTAVFASFDARRSPVQAQQPVRGQGGLIALDSDTEPTRHQVVVIDPKSRALSVYHIDYATGQISLKSVRNIDADLLMDEFNTDSPLPKEIRAILDQR